MTDLQKEIIKVCLAQLEDACSTTCPSDIADEKTLEVVGILRFLIGE